ncbi:MAG: hypothetical protein OXJ55_09015 [Caldilineaceae bacterium]|nr:hypothetical protein [Caldilineaceae bacterium]
MTGGVPPTQFHGLVKGFSGGEPGNDLVVAGSDLLQVGVEPVGLCGAVFYQFTAVGDQDP